MVPSIAMYHNNSITHQLFIYTQLNVKIVLFQTIPFCISTHFTSIWSIDKTQSGATRMDLGAMAIKGYSVFPKNGNKGILRIPLRSSNTGASPSNARENKSKKADYRLRLSSDTFLLKMARRTKERKNLNRRLIVSNLTLEPLDFLSRIPPLLPHPELLILFLMCNTILAYGL